MRGRRGRGEVGGLSCLLHRMAESVMRMRPASMVRVSPVLGCGTGGLIRARIGLALAYCFC